MIYLSLHESYYMNKYCSFFFIVIDTRYVAHTEMQGTSVKFDPCVRHVHQMWTPFEKTILLIHSVQAVSLDDMHMKLNQMFLVILQ